MRRNAINCKASALCDDRFREEILYVKNRLELYQPVGLTIEIEKFLKKLINDSIADANSIFRAFL